MKKRICIMLGAFLLLCLTGCEEDTLQYMGESALISDEGKETELSVDVFENSKVHTQVDDVITVHISGEVYFPGVYQVYGGSRVYEVVRLAGGFTTMADEDAINQAKEVFDGEKITIPGISSGDDLSGKEKRININSADIELLCTIPGIGETRAKQIIEYREKNGNFTKIEDLMRISGIKEGMFEKMAPYITVS